MLYCGNNIWIFAAINIIIAGYTVFLSFYDCSKDKLYTADIINI